MAAAIKTPKKPDPRFGGTSSGKPEDEIGRF
jgi:hypothetical protein